MSDCSQFILSCVAPWSSISLLSHLHDIFASNNDLSLVIILQVPCFEGNQTIELHLDSLYFVMSHELNVNCLELIT